MDLHYTPGTPAIGDDGTVYIGEGHEWFYAFAPDGEVRWRISLPGGAYMSVAIGYDGTIFCGGGHLYALSPDGHELWRYRPEGDRSPSDTIGATTPDGMIYFGSFDHSVYALNRGGEKVWSYRTGDIVFGAPAIGADGTLYTCSKDGYLYALAAIPEQGAWAALLAPALALCLRMVRRR
jgi:outer membrane protein assembly factor BamB